MVTEKVEATGTAGIGGGAKEHAWTTSNSVVFVALDLMTFALKAAIAGLQMLSTFWCGWHDDP